MKVNLISNLISMKKIKNERFNAVSSVIGVILILAVLASIITSVTVYKLPVFEKRVEFNHELHEANSFSKLLNVYSGDNESVQLELGAETSIPLIQVYEDSTIKVWKSGIIEVYLNTTSGNVTFSGKFFAVNLSIYPSKLPYFNAALSEGGLIFTQDDNINLTTYKPYNYINNSIIVKGNSATIYIDNFKIYGYRIISGNGFVVVEMHVQKDRINYSGVRSVTIGISGIFKSYWNEALLSKGFTNLSSEYVYNFNGSGKVIIIKRNYSIYIW